jgi:hypothetical protein
LFPEGATISEAYNSSYILKPISIVAKFKQNNKSSKTEPIYNISLEIDDFQIKFMKS